MSDRDIDFYELVRMLWQGKWIIGSVALAGAIFGVVVALMLPNVYRAEALLAPTQNQGPNGLSALAAQYGGLASLAGINLSQGATDKSVLGLEVLKSRKFLTEFIVRHDILVPLMAAEGWSASTDTVQIDSSVYDEQEGRWLRDVDPPKTPEPSLQEAYRKFRSEVLTVSQNRSTGFVTVGVEHYSPTIAKQWVDWLVADLNAAVMRQDVEQAEQAIDYLEAQIAATSLNELKVVFFRLIEEQTKTVMLAKVSPEYLFSTVDPAVAPERRVKPNRKLIAMVSVMLGGLLGMLFAIVRATSTRRRAALQ
jgi:uncharacterized protein involved in exopolysaccharide biosynthesis